MVDEEQQAVSFLTFTGPVISLGVGGNVFFQIRDKATGRISRFEVLDGNFGDDTATVGNRVKVNMWFSLLRESLINKTDVTIGTRQFPANVPVSLTVGEPFI